VESPIGHLNASPTLTAYAQRYNECVPVRTAYSSNWARTALYGLPHVLEHEVGARDPSLTQGVDNASDFSLGRRPIWPEERQIRYREVIIQLLAQLVPHVFLENGLDAGWRGLHPYRPDESELAGLPPNAIDRAAAERARPHRDGF